MESGQNSSALKTKFNIKSQKVLRLHTVQRQSNIFDPQNIARNKSLSKIRIPFIKATSPQIIKKKPRKYTQVDEDFTSPESLTKLSPFKQYESKLNLSAESWIIYDMKANAYKRGWKPNRPSNFNGLMKILILLCYCQLIERNQNIRRVRVRINPEHLKEEKVKISKKDELHLKWMAQRKKTIRTLSKGTTLKLIDIVMGMVISGNQDLFEYSLIYIGYLINHSENLPHDLIISLTKARQQQQCAQHFLTYCHSQLFPSLNLSQTKVLDNEEGYELISTPNQICSIFLQGFEKHQFFKDVISMDSVRVDIKYQVGFKYWEDRTIVIKKLGRQTGSEYFCYLVYKGAKNYEALCYNLNLGILMIVQDSKFSMAELDVNVLEKWYATVTKPINSNGGKSSSMQKKLSAVSPLIKTRTIFPILQISRA